MGKVISCCGVVCSECPRYPEQCRGCPSIEGKAYWVEYTGEEVCSIYECCVNTKKYTHCGKCTLLPCRNFEGNDPTKTMEENEEDHRKQLAQLRVMD